MIGFAQNTRDEVRIQGDGTLSGALSAQPGMKQTTYVCETVASHAAKDAPVIFDDTSKEGEMTVRRLTPRECERLQGFPDDWTLIPYRGKPAEDCPDGPRYKAIGNSMAVPVMKWIFERMEAASNRVDAL